MMLEEPKREVPTRGYIGGLMALLFAAAAVFLSHVNGVLFWSAVGVDVVGVPIILFVWWHDRHQTRD